MKTRISFVIVFVSGLLVAMKAFAQEWEYVRIYDSNDSIRPNCMQSLTELESGDIIVNALWRDNCVNGTRSENPALMKFSSDGVLQKEVYWSRFGYRSDDQYIIESPDHNIIVMGHFLPDRDPDCANFVLEGSDKAYLYFYKMDSDFNMIDSVEYLIPLDTTNNAAFYQAGGWGYPNISMAKIKLTSAFVEDGCIVGSYTKTQMRYDNYALDSLFFFKMDFDGNFLVHKGISLGDRGSDPYAFNDQMISNDIGYVHYHSGQNNSKNIGDNCVLVDKDFNYVKTMGVDVPPESGWPRRIDFEMVRKSPWGTTFMSCLIDHESSSHDAFLQEMTENTGTVVVLHRKEAITDDYDMTALRSPASFTDDGIIWAYTRDRGLWRDHDSWVMIEKLNHDFGLEREVYYPYQDWTNLNCNSYIVSRDGGVLLLSYCHELDNTNINHYILTKFPAEAFEGIDEAHDNGLKVAIAYPNPGKGVLNIRTALQNAHLEIYDLSGKLIHNQRITDNITSINAESWPSGTYIWMVYAGVSTGSTTLAETGRWIKE
ncbi:MAG: T9SS type A sorting domain-containing protein [Bacteroidales bacterium]|nr:T9SS type A sorting domain-containing protein [Bacteroidales bacterium]